MLKKVVFVLTLIALASSLNFYYSHMGHNEFVVMSKTPRYYYNQMKRSGACSLDGMCDGQRKCSHDGKCFGTARPQKSETYYYDQTITSSKCPVPGDRNFAITDYFCNGKRTCKSGLCSGSQR